MSPVDAPESDLTTAVDAPVSRPRKLRAAITHRLTREPTTQPPLTLPLWVHAGVLLAVVAVSAYIAYSMWGWTYDDAFIIYRYARNFAGGLGMVYNPGEHIFGTTSPAYTLLLAAIYKLAPGADMLALGSLVSTLSFVACGALAWFIGVQTRSPLAGSLAALIAITNPLMIVHWGGEMPLLLALVLGTALSYSRGLGTLTGALLGLAVLTRQDSLVLMGAVAAHYLLTRRKLPVGAIASFLVVLVPWLVYSWAFFGSPVPSTLEAKIIQGKAGFTLFLSGSLEWLSQILGPGLPRYATYALILAGGVTLLWEAAKRRPVGPWFLVLAWSALFTAGYTVLRVAFYGWYALPLATGLCILMAWGASGIAQAAGAAGKRLANLIHRESIGVPRAVLGAAVLVTLVLVCWQPVTRLRDFDQNFLSYHRLSDLYERVGKWLAAQGGPSVSAAYLEIGEVGYYSDSRLIDLMGLVTPGAANRVLTGDFDWAVQRYRPTYYLASTRFNDLLANVQEESWFAAAYDKVATFEDPWQRTANVYRMDVYKLRSGATLPSPLRPVAAQKDIQKAYWPIPGAPAGRDQGQTFKATGANLSAISIRTGKPDPGAVGTLVLHLRHSPTDSQEIRRVSVPLSEVGANSWTTLRFEPLPDSLGKTYFFSVELSDTRPGENPPVALFYSTDDLYPGGTRYVGPRAVPGDLCFRASVPDE